MNIKDPHPGATCPISYRHETHDARTVCWWQDLRQAVRHYGVSSSRLRFDQLIREYVYSKMMDEDVLDDHKAMFGLKEFKCPICLGLWF